MLFRKHHIADIIQVFTKDLKASEILFLRYKCVFPFLFIGLLTFLLVYKVNVAFRHPHTKNEPAVLLSSRI